MSQQPKSKKIDTPAALYTALTKESRLALGEHVRCNRKYCPFQTYLYVDSDGELMNTYEAGSGNTWHQGPDYNLLDYQEGGIHHMPIKGSQRDFFFEIFRNASDSIQKLILKGLRN